MSCLFVEINFIKSLKEYLRFFSEFANTLEAADKDKIKRWISAADLFQGTIQYPMQEITTAGNIHMTLSIFGIQKPQDIPLDMIEFFDSSPYFSKPFNYVKSIRDLNQFVQ
ncbi:MAG: hypothetical protein KKD44_22660 [Proteobacteria bacterium]|nr:hypothetical protein [Pseudomonadota bacterium]